MADTAEDKQLTNEALRAVGSGNHIIRDALQGRRGISRLPNPSSSTNIPTSSAPLPTTSARLPTSSAHPHGQQTVPVTTPATTSRQTQPNADRRYHRWRHQPADQFLKQGGTQGIACAICDKSFSSRYHARTHVRKQHSDRLQARAAPSSAREPTVHLCDQCDFVGTSSHDLSTHIDIRHR